jgi:hypothetical protein
MNHTKTSTLGIATAIVALAVIMVAATALTTGHNALAAKGNKVKVGNTRTTAIQAADNSQHCAFGAGSSTDSCSNTPRNDQSQTTNAGSTGSG